MNWRKGVHRYSNSLLTLPALIFIILFSIYPFFELVRMSFSKVTSYNVVQGGWPWVGLKNFYIVFTSQTFYATALNTLVFVLIVVGVGMAGGLLAAVLLRNNNLFSKFCLGVMVFVWAIPPVVLGSLWKFIFLREGFLNVTLQNIGLLDSPVAWLTNPAIVLVVVSLVNSWAVIPFAALVYGAALLKVPPDLYEAAKLDGAGPIRLFFNIDLPFLTSTTLILGILTTVYAFRSFDFIYVLTFGGPGVKSTTMPFLSYKLSFMIYKFGLGSAVAIITIFVVIGLGPLYIRILNKHEQ